MNRSAARSQFPSAARQRCATRSRASTRTARPHRRPDRDWRSAFARPRRMSRASKRGSTSLHAQEEQIRKSLHQRRGVMAEVLMALQRIGRTPPPAILSRPEDALAAIRGSILAGAVLPDLRDEAEKLAADLTRADAGHREDRDGARYASHTLRVARRRAGAHRPSGQAKKAQRTQTEAALACRTRQGGGASRQGGKPAIADRVARERGCRCGRSGGGGEDSRR